MVEQWLKSHDEQLMSSDNRINNAEDVFIMYTLIKVQAISSRYCTLRTLKKFNYITDQFIDHSMDASH